MTRGPLNNDELAAVLDPASDILDEVVGARQGEIIRAMAFEIRLHRDTMAPHMLRATRLYTDELGALRKRVAELEAGLPVAWTALTDWQRYDLAHGARHGCGSLDTSCQCWNDE